MLFFFCRSFEGILADLNAHPRAHLRGKKRFFFWCENASSTPSEAWLAGWIVTRTG